MWHQAGHSASLSHSFFVYAMGTLLLPQPSCWADKHSCRIKPGNRTERGCYFQLLLFSHQVVSNSSVTMWTIAHHGLIPRLPWDFPGKNTCMGLHFLLQGIFPTQGLVPSLLHGSRFFTTGVCWLWGFAGGSEIKNPPAKQETMQEMLV